MSSYKKHENYFFRHLSIKIKHLLFITKCVINAILKLGKQRLTIMFIPHSGEKIFNFQSNVFTLIFILGLIITISSGFFFLSTHFFENSKVLTVQSEDLDKTKIDLETLKEEVVDLQKISNSFKGSLNNTLDLLGVKTFKEKEAILELTDLHDQFRELDNVKNLKYYLIQSILTLNKVNGALLSQRDFLVDIPTFWPTKGIKGRITNNFGLEEHPFTHQWYLHRGVDIAFGYNVPIVATANGKIVTIEYEPMGFGNYITIKHKYGFYTKYAHLNKVNVKRGQDVLQGQIIGLMGSTGLSTGPHVHYEVRIGSEVVDPSKYLNINSEDISKNNQDNFHS